MKSFNIFSVVAIFLILGGCSPSERPSVEILGKKNVVLSKDSDGRSVFKNAEEVNVRGGDSAVWFVYVRTNRDKIKLVEEIQLNGPSKWKFPDPSKANTTIVSYKVSNDLSSATITREVSVEDGYVYGVWRANEDEPRGKMTVKVMIEGQSEAAFSWKLQ